MKNTIKKILIIALIAVIGFSMASCDPEGDGNQSGGGNTDPKSITITDIIGYTGICEIRISNGPNLAASGRGVINSRAVTVPLYQYDNNEHEVTDVEWTGNGSFYIVAVMDIASAYQIAWYSDGKTLSQVGISPDYSNLDIRKCPKFNINQQVTTISYDKFLELDI
jgi:hypothetical protein